METAHDKHPTPKHVLAALRRVTDLRQKELAALLGCSLDTIKSVETGRLPLSESMAARISLRTGVSIEWLLSGDPKAQITSSVEARNMREDYPASRCSMTYTKSTFDLVRAREEGRRAYTSTHYERLRGLKDYARLRAIVESARDRYLYGLARYRLDRFLEEMESEFGPGDGVLPTGQGSYDNERDSIEFVEAELAAARRTAHHVFDVIDPDSMMSEKEWGALAAELAAQKKVSPYPKRSKAKKEAGGSGERTK